MPDGYRIFSFPDIHSHVPGEGRVLSVDFTQQPLLRPDGQPFTLGVHPWYADREIDWDAFEEMLSHPEIVGVGEAGLDNLRGPSIEVQMPVFERQIALASKHQLPLVIHSVRTNHLLSALKKRYKPEVPWIIHGFRGNVKEAAKLLDEGFHLSIGERYAPGIFELDRPGFLHRESDEEKQ